MGVTGLAGVKVGTPKNLQRSVGGCGKWPGSSVLVPACLSGMSPAGPCEPLSASSAICWGGGRGCRWHLDGWWQSYEGLPLRQGVGCRGQGAAGRGGSRLRHRR